MPYICDATSITPGDIVRVEKPLGPSGRPTYAHLFVVMAVPDPLKSGDVLPCLGISSRTPAEAIDPEQHVSLRWMDRRGGHPATGLTRPSIAKVTFQHRLTVRAGRQFALEVDAECGGKYLPADHFQALVALANAYYRK